MVILQEVISFDKYYTSHKVRKDSIFQEYYFFFFNCSFILKFFHMKSHLILKNKKIYLP